MEDVNKSVHHFVLFKDVPVLKMHSGGGSGEILEVRAHRMDNGQLAGPSFWFNEWTSLNGVCDVYSSIWEEF